MSDTEFSADRPLPPGGHDRLGFQAIAQRLSQSLLSQTAKDGLVLGVEGSWGSGKSSLLNLVVAELQSHSDETEIVRFDPWLVGERDALLIDLMGDLAKAVERIQAPSDSKIQAAKKQGTDIATKLRSYAARVGRLTGPLSNLAALVVPGAGILGDVVKNLAEAAQATETVLTLDDLKSDLVADLRGLSKRIVILVDDLDRLEPKEAVEVMRLIRSVADFPNIIYVLCYDKEILTLSIAKALSISGGAKFIEKIMQVTFKLPLPEAFDLRQWLMDECLKFYVANKGADLDHDNISELRRVCDQEGSSLTTPRDIIRFLNAFKLYWPPIRETTYFPDVVWIQLIRLNNEHFFNWIERYMVGIAANVNEKAQITPSERKSMAIELKNHINSSEDITHHRSLWTLSQYLPGVEGTSDINDQSLAENIFNAKQHDIKKFENSSRLGSPRRCGRI